MSYSADFTPKVVSDQDVICGRDQCEQKFYPPGTKLHHLHSNVPGEDGRDVCDRCYHYYRSKQTTRRRPDLDQQSDHRNNVRYNDIPDSQALVKRPIIDKNSIYRQNILAQRGLPSNPIQAVGRHDASLMPPPPLPSCSFGPHHYIAPGSGNHSRVSSLALPSVALPGHTRAILPPSTSSSSANAQGYTLNHVSYESMRDHYARYAYAGHAGQVVVVQIQIVHMPEGKTKGALIGDLLEAEDNIPVHIGARELKSILFAKILPKWTLYTNGFPLSIDNVIMRTKDWVKIEPKNPDVDAISKEFFKPSKKKGLALEFKSGRTLVLFHIPNDLYNRWLDGKQVESELAMDDAHNRSIGQRGRKRMHIETAGGTSRSNQGSLSEVSPPSTPPPKRGRNTSPGVTPRSEMPLDSPPSPDKSSIMRALRTQEAPSKAAVRTLFDVKSIDVLAYPVKHQTFANLIHASAGSDRDNRNLDDPHDIKLRLSTAEPEKAGGFKIAIFGTTNTPLLGSSTSVIAKQTFYQKKKAVETGNGKIKIFFQNIPYDGTRQALDLTTEVNCLVWARALLDMVYQFIDRQIKERGSPPFAIPRMRYVEAALAVEQSADKRVFLLEEVIHAGTEGMFRKYLNNVSAVPAPQDKESDADRAEFLAFTQHVQYIRTKKMAFVSDYQGGNTLLTDPQIMTDSQLGLIFANGNVPAGYRSFERDHVCNRYCRYFELPTNYAEGDGDKGSNSPSTINGRELGSRVSPLPSKARSDVDSTSDMSISASKHTA